MAVLQNVKKVTVLNAGHHLKDQGASHKKEKESEHTIKIRDELSSLLELHGFHSLIIPDILNLSKSIEMGNLYVKDLNGGFFLDIHLNSRGFSAQNQPVRGVECYSGYSVTSKEVSRILSRNLANEIGTIDRGWRPHTESGPGSLGWITKTNGWAVVLECLYLDNEDDRGILLSEGGHKRISHGIMKGICELYGLAFIELPKEEPKEEEEEVVTLQLKVIELLKKVKSLINELIKKYTNF